MHQDASLTVPQTCATCQVQFQPRRRWQRFCSSTCRRTFHKSNGQEADRLTRLEREVADLQEQVARIRGHLVL